MAATKRRTRREGGGWTFRLLGLVVVAFFALGVLVGMSHRNRPALPSKQELTKTLRGRLVTVAPVVRALFHSRSDVPIVSTRPPGKAVVAIERRGSFYALYSNGSLRGPISAGAVGDLAILSGGALKSASGPALVRYAAMLVRSEAKLSQPISQMRVESDGTIVIFLDRTATQVILNFDDFAGELKRASQVMAHWRGREGSIALLDMTIAGEAVVRLRGIAAGRTPKGRAREAAIAQGRGV